jgi:hypothetical protein
MTKGFVKLTGIVMLSLVCIIVLAVPGSAQSHPVEGTYSVTATSTELGALNFLMILKRGGDKWAGEVKDSPTPLTVTSVTVDESNKITIVGDAGGTAVTIVGKFDGGKIVGDWTAGDIKGTWTAMKKDDAAQPADKTVASTSAAPDPAKTGAAMAAGIEGTYDVKVIADGQGELPFTLLIKRDGEKLVTEVPGGGDLQIVGIETKDPDVVNLSATFQGNPFQLPGKRAGDEMGGKWEAGGFTGSWSAKRKK